MTTIKIYRLYRGRKEAKLAEWEAPVDVRSQAALTGALLSWCETSRTPASEVMLEAYDRKSGRHVPDFRV